MVNDQKIVIFEYKKDLNTEEKSKLNDFLLKAEEGLKDEGLDGVIQICKGWRNEPAT
jgi:hypothetical protein